MIFHSRGRFLHRLALHLLMFSGLMLISSFAFGSSFDFDSEDIPNISVDVWNTQSQSLNLHPSQFQSLKGSALPLQKKQNLIRACHSRVLNQERNQISSFFTTQRPCMGKVGESACLKEHRRQAIDACLAEKVHG